MFFLEQIMQYVQISDDLAVLLTLLTEIYFKNNQKRELGIFTLESSQNIWNVRGISGIFSGSLEYLVSHWNIQNSIRILGISRNLRNLIRIFGISDSAESQQNLRYLIRIFEISRIFLESLESLESHKNLQNLIRIFRISLKSCRNLLETLSESHLNIVRTIRI